MTDQLKREARDLEPGDHLSLIYRGRDQQLAGLVPLVVEALSRGHRCRYLTDRKSREAIESALGDAGIPVSEERERGRLEISSGRESFLDDGAFDPSGVDEIFEADLDRALADGFQALWWISETSWLLGRCRSDDVKAMEAHAQEAVRSRPMIVVCQYDRERLDDDGVAEVLAAHPLAILGDEVSPNPFYEPPAVILEREEMTRADWMIRQLERQREVQARLESREREIATLLENSPDLVARLDREHRYLYVNPIVEDFTGRSAEERLGRSHEEIVPDLEPGRPWFHAIDRAFETGKEQSVEASFETPRGVRWFETRIVPEGPTEAGRDAPVEDPETVLVVARDITDRIESEKERRRFEELYRDLFHLSRDGIFITRLDGTIVDMNPAAERILAGDLPDAERADGLRDATEDVSARSFYRNPERRDELLRALEKGPVQDFHVRARRLDGSSAEFLLSAIPWRDSDGEVIGMKGILRDVTEEELRRRQLEQTTRLFEKTLSSLDEAVFIVETGTRKIIHCNDAAERIFGYDRSEMIDHPSEFLHVDADHNRRFHEESWELVESGETFRSEFQMRRKDGSVFPTFHTVAPLGSELGMENAVVSVVRDLTRQKRLERRLREIGRQERRRLAHDLHDELGQELTALALQANELRRTVSRDGDDPLDLADELEEGLNKAIQSIRHVARGLLPEELEKRGLAEILEELAGERRRSLLGVEVEVDVDSGITFSVEETAHLYRIAQEALLNAFRHGRASSVAIRALEEDRHRILRVRDDGIGFERSSSGSEGSGMGLEVMRHRAEAMGGSLEIETRAGWGTTVTCILPRSPITVTTELA